uniref:Uncharacterized protein n=1 Tax=Bursaphelenchus xylophilus TaxID=6326 RepID=A0A1I7S1U2_BURXY
MIYVARDGSRFLFETKMKFFAIENWKFFCFQNQVAIRNLPKVTATTLSPRRMIGEQLTVIPMSAFSQNPRKAFTAQPLPQTIKTPAIPTLRPYLAHNP